MYMNVKELKNLKKISAFYGDFAIFETKDEKSGLINRKGEVLIPAGQYELIYHHCDDIFSLWTKKDDGSISVTTYFDAKLGKEVEDPKLPSTPKRELPKFAKKYADAYWCANGRIAFKEGELYGIMDENGNIMVAPSFDWIQHSHPYGYKNTRINVKIDGLQGYLDLDGKVVIPIIYPFVSHTKSLGIHKFHDKENKWGYMNEKGEVIIPAIYDAIDARDTYGLDEIAVTKDGRCYFINANQEEVEVF